MAEPDWDWSRVVVDHIRLNVGDYEASRRFYETVLAPLDIPLLGEMEGRSAMLGNLNVYRRDPVSRNVHLCFVARTREAVDAFHRAGVRAGYRSNGRPGYRAEYGAGYYAAFLLDPDGNNIEALHRVGEELEGGYG